MSGQAGSEQRPHKVSYTVLVKGGEATSVISQLQQDLQAAGISAKVIYSGGEDLDILPQQASKGKGLEFLLQQVCPKFVSASWQPMARQLYHAEHS